MRSAQVSTASGTTSPLWLMIPVACTRHRFRRHPCSILKHTVCTRHRFPMCTRHRFRRSTDRAVLFPQPPASAGLWRASCDLPPPRRRFHCGGQARGCGRQAVTSVAHDLCPAQISGSVVIRVHPWQVPRSAPGADSARTHKAAPTARETRTPFIHVVIDACGGHFVRRANGFPRLFFERLWPGLVPAHRAGLQQSVDPGGTVGPAAGRAK